MKVQKITFTSTNTKETQNKKTFNKNFLKNPTPLTVGTMNAVGWFGFGMVLDTVLGKFFKSMQQTKKSALLLNALFGLGMGIFSGVREVYLNKQTKEPR